MLKKKQELSESYIFFRFIVFILYDFMILCIPMQWVSHYERTMYKNTFKHCTEHWHCVKGGGGETEVVSVTINKTIAERCGSLSIYSFCGWKYLDLLCVFFTVTKIIAERFGSLSIYSFLRLKVFTFYCVYSFQSLKTYILELHRCKIHATNTETFLGEKCIWMFTLAYTLLFER